MVDQLAHDVGARVRFRRLAAKKTQAVVAGLAGITVDYLYQIERGKKAPTLSVLAALAHALDVPVSSLIEDQTSVTPRVSAQSPAGGALFRAMTLPVADDDAVSSTGELRQRVDGAWRLWQSSAARYSTVPALVGELVVDVERSLRGAADRKDMCVAADLYGLVRNCGQAHWPGGPGVRRR